MRKSSNVEVEDGVKVQTKMQGLLAHNEKSKGDVKIRFRKDGSLAGKSNLGSNFRYLIQMSRI